jgi:NTE family protein
MTKKINLGLQGGGSHGAFSWGVLDRLLEDGRLDIDALTGASAGAVNAVVLADGLADGDREKARETLHEFWHGISATGAASPLRRSAWEMARGSWSLDNSPAYIWFDMVSRVASPYDLNPLNLNPLKYLLNRHVDFERVRRSPVKVFVSATNVETGRARVFARDELTVDHILASACLPFLFHAVTIEGSPYWDGGYMGNPPLWPLFDHAESDDVLIVQINPVRRPGVPKSAREILNRLNEITFNASLLRELRAIDFVSRLLEEGRLEGTGYRRVLVHAISDEVTLPALGASSKLNTEDAFLHMLFEKGRVAASTWLEENFDAVGRRSSINIREFFMGEDDPLDGKRISRPAEYETKKKRSKG